MITLSRPTLASIAASASLLLGLSGCSKAPTLKAVRVTRARVESTVTTTSSGTVSAEQQAILSFGTAGRVSRIRVKAGSRVKQGEVLAEQENADLKTIFADAANELKRSQELYDTGLVAKAALDGARKAYEVARVNLEKSIIKAPFDGIVTEVNLELGELSSGTSAVSSAKPPIRLIDLKPRHVKGDIDEVDLSKVRAGQTARIKIQAARGEPYPAEVIRVVPYVSTAKEQDRTSEIELKITESRPELIPVGASADIEVITEAKPDALAVPARVILGHGGQRYVFRYADGTVTRANVGTGIGNYARAEIASGLHEGDLVVYPPDEIELKDGIRAKAEIVPWP